MPVLEQYWRPYSAIHRRNRLPTVQKPLPGTYLVPEISLLPGGTRYHRDFSYGNVPPCMNSRLSNVYLGRLRYQNRGAETPHTKTRECTPSAARSVSFVGNQQAPITPAPQKRCEIE
eukprot:3500805-Rhodomonas_salina.1